MLKAALAIMDILNEEQLLQKAFKDHEVSRPSGAVDDVIFNIVILTTGVPVGDYWPLTRSGRGQRTGTTH